MSTKVMIVDDHMIVRQGLKALLEKEQNIEVTAEAANGREAIQLALELAPDVIIMDVNMPEMNGVEATRHILKDNPAIRIIILSMCLELACMREALKRGARGYVIKGCASEELVVAINTTMAGFPYLCGEVSELLIKDYTQSADERPSGHHSPLSGREREILRLIAEGKNTKEIAFEFDRNVKTIEGLRNKIMRKLDLNSLADLTRYAIREGLAGFK